MSNQPAQLEFDAERHLYSRGGLPVPGFSQIREAMGIGNGYKPRNLQDYLDEGTALHSWFLFLCQGQEPDAPPDERIAGRVAGIQKFLRDTQFRFVDGEKPLLCDNPLFATTPDAWGYLGDDACLVELKRSAKAKWHPLQTAAEAMAIAQAGFKVSRRLNLYLRDGNYVLDEHRDREDFSRWRAIVNGYHARGWYL